MLGNELKKKNLLLLYNYGIECIENYGNIFILDFVLL